MANGIRGNIIRSRTGNCNREDRPNYQRRIYEARFGIYRPISGETAKYLGGIITNIHKDAETYLEGRRTSHQRAHATTRSDPGATYLQRMHCGDALRKKQIDTSAGFRVKDAIEADKELNRNLAVPLSGVEWVGVRQQKLALIIGGHASEDELDIELQDAQLERLAKDNSILESVLEDTNTTALKGRIKTPDHITILNYAGSTDAHIAAVHKEQIMEIAYEHIVSDDVHTVTLGGMTVRSFEPLS